MRITSPLFDAFLKCATKCHLRSLDEVGSGNEYAEWVRGRDESYQREAAQRLQEAVPETERAVSPPATENLKAAKWRLAVDLVAQTPDRLMDSSLGTDATLADHEPPTTRPSPCPLPAMRGEGGRRPEEGRFMESDVRKPAPNEELRGPGGPRAEQLLESRLHAVERVPSEGRGKTAQFIPIRFVFRNKLTKDDRLLLAFDALVLSQLLGREVSLGKIIHGDDHATLKGKTSALVGEVRKRVKKMAALLSSPSPPDLVLNRHCAECEFQARCRKIAVEKDDLSLLATMSAKERKKLHSKGIFTITQLSYTFRPRRRPKKLRDKREKYHHSLKALAIREKKIHIVGSPELKIEGTPVYLDVEGLPDRDFYYLIGLRIGNGESAVQHSLWADTVADEGKIWREFLGILETVEKPVLIHYGSYETEFLRQMGKRHEPPLEDSAAAKATGSGVNLAAVIFSQIYFPTYSNRLKELGTWLKYAWPSHTASGLETVAHRNEWESYRGAELRRSLIDYNTCDCIVLGVLKQEIQRLCQEHQPNAAPSASGPVHTDSMQSDLPYRFGKVKYALPEFEAINKASYWDYQRMRIRLRSSARPKTLQKIASRTIMQKRVFSKTIESCISSNCPHCNGTKIRRKWQVAKVVLDIQFTRTGLRRTSVRYLHRSYECHDCGITFTDRPEQWSKHLNGSGLLAFVCYQLVQQRLSQRMITDGLLALFGIKRGFALVRQLKERAAEFYRGTYERLKETLMRGEFIHADETHVSLDGKRSFVWVFSSAKEAVFVHTNTREGSFLGEFFKGFKGVLVSDFYAAYDSIPCRQQKCLIHLMRDINSDLLKHPFDDDMRQLAQDFADLLRAMVDTVDRFGLRARFLRKHKRAVNSFFRNIERQTTRSETAEKYCNRMLKCRDKLFTFLDHNEVSWNNNSAEHAVKAFVLLRKVIGGSSTKKGIGDYLILLSIYETCKRNDVAFLDFLRSGETDIHAFAESRRGRRRRTRISQPDGLREDAIPDAGSQANHMNPQVGK